VLAVEPYLPLPAKKRQLLTWLAIPNLQDCLYLQHITEEVDCTSSLAVLSPEGDFGE
jgi:hypothetical protein